MFQPAAKNEVLSRRLAAYPFFSNLSASARAELVREVVPVEVDEGTLLVDEGQDCGALVLVETGQIRVFKRAPSGREITLYTVEPGESCVLGTSCVLRHSPYPAVAVASRKLRGLAISADHFQRLFELEGGARDFVMDLFSTRMAAMMLLVEEVAFNKIDQRLARFLCEQAARDEGVLRPVSLSHEQIAAHLGTAREVVSRLVQQYADAGLLNSERRQIQVIDLPGLRARSSRE